MVLITFLLLLRCDLIYSLKEGTIGTYNNSIPSSQTLCVSNPKPSSIPIVLFSNFEGLSFSLINSSNDIIESASNETFGFSFCNKSNIRLAVTNGNSSEKRLFSFTYVYLKHPVDVAWITNQNCTFT